jgi:hypothetical protein
MKLPLPYIWTVAVPIQESAYLMSTAELMEAQKFRTETYRRETISTEREEIHVYVFDSMDLTSATEMLIDGYKKP